MISIVVGLAFGDEGKGKTVAWLAKDADIVVRAGGGPQAGHTVGKDFVCQIPSGFINPDAKLCIGRGTVLNVKTVLSEIKKYNVEDRIKIDYGCTIIEDEDIEQEKELVSRIGSVGTGVGPARVKRLLRTGLLAKDIPELYPYLDDVGFYIVRNRDFKDIVIEGVQGYGLDLMNHEYYPHVTSQSTIASQFASDAGIGPLYINKVYGVCKIYNSRVADGKLYNEWSEDKKKLYGIDERGTISGRIRRIGDFDIELISKAMMINGVSDLVINCVDRMFPLRNGVVTTEAKSYISNILRSLPLLAGNGHIYLGIGPNANDVIAYE